MTQQTINVGTVAGDNTGDPGRTAFQKINSNFAELYNGIGGSVLLSGVAGTNTITATSTTYSAYFTGSTVSFVAAGANTGAVTLNINGLGAKAITKQGSTALTQGDIKAGQIVMVTYDGTRFQLIPSKINPIVSATDFGAVGDGVTDDTAAIQAALNAALAAGGGAVTLVRGLTYKVTSKISIPSNCGLVGDGTATIYAPAANFNNTSLTNRYASNSAVIDMSGQTGSPFTASANPFLIGVKIQSQVSQGRCVDAVVIRNATSAVVRDCEIYGFPVGCGIKAASLSGETLFANNYIHDFLDNTTSWVGTPQSTAIEIDGDRINSVYSFGVKILNNEIKQIQLGAAAVTSYGYQTDGINIQSISGADFIVTGNRIIDVGEGIDHWGERSVISNNSFTNTYAAGSKLIYGAAYNAIQGYVI